MVRLIIFVSVLVPQIAAAQTIANVSGTIRQGESITISGSAFGTKPTAAPLKFDDFQTVAMGADIITSKAKGPAWMVRGWRNVHDPIASASRLRPGTPYTRNMMSHWTAPHPESSSSIALLDQAITTLYLDAWIFNDYTSGVKSGSPENVKHVRLHAGDISAPNLGFTDVGPRGETFYEVAGDALARDYSLSGYATAREMYGAWVHVQWMFDVGSGRGACNGKVRMYINGALRRSANDACLTGNANSSYPQLFIGNYVRTDDYRGDVYSWWDTLYVDTSWARVELSNNANYGKATHREIQMPSAWSPTSVTATVNRGSFSANESVYVHVCTSTDACSRGFGPLKVAAGN
jgi:hypothetical protein